MLIMCLYAFLYLKKTKLILTLKIFSVVSPAEHMLPHSQTLSWRGKAYVDGMQKSIIIMLVD